VASTLRPQARARLAGSSPTHQARQANESFWRRNALSLVCFAFFLIFVVGLVLTGQREFNAAQLEHGEATVSLASYLREGHFWEALFENWESEFLQMAAYVVLTVFLIQKGSSESKDPDKHEAVDDDPRDADKRKPVPWPVRRGGIWLVLYENSLLLAFVVLFLGSIVGHALGGVNEYNAEQLAHGQPTVGLWSYATGAQFWFESFQNWQSEFLAVFAIVTLSIYLRQRGSPESKPVAGAHSQTGTA
jgi:hypothetical protein